MMRRMSTLRIPKGHEALNIVRVGGDFGPLISAGADILASVMSNLGQFDWVVGMAVRSGAFLVPMMQACKAIGVVRGATSPERTM